MTTASSAVGTLNAMPVEAFKSIARRVIRRLGSPEEASLLTRAEEQQACATLGLTTDALSALVDLCAFVFEQAAYQMQRPEQLEQHVASSLGVATAQAAAARQVWETEAAAYVSRLRGKHMLGRRILRDTTWRTQLCLATKAGGRKATSESSTAVLDLELGDEKGGSPERLVAEASHAELYTFFLQLQDIQGRIDQLSS